MMDKNHDMMSNKKHSMIIIVVSITLIIISIALGYNVFDLSSKLQKTTDTLTRTISEKESLELEVDRLVIEKNDLEASLQDERTDKDRIQFELNQKDQLLISKKRELDYLKGEVGRMRMLFEDEKTERTDITMELIKLKEDHEKSKNLLSQIRVAKEKLEQKLRNILTDTKSDEPQSFEIETTIETEGGEVEVVIPEQTVGDVLTVNREYNFVVINLGKNNGINSEQDFSVYRQGHLVGRVRIQKVYDSMSAADIISEEPNNKIKKGDIIRLS